MGLRSSSNIANAAFCHANELCGLGLLCSASRQSFAIKSYTRYFDNLLFVCKPEYDKIRALKQQLESGLAPYRCVVEEISVSGVTFLDLDIVKDDLIWKHTGHLSFKPF